MSGPDSIRERQEEFRSHVWNHAEDAFQVEFDNRRPLDANEAAHLRVIAAAIAEGRDDQTVADLIKASLEEDETLMDAILQIPGLTRNKIKTDLTALGAKRGLAVPSNYRRLHKKMDVWALGGAYLAARLRTVLGPVAALRDEKTIDAALESLNQATWPGWIRQQRAKLQGHEAEYRLATLLKTLGIPFEPQEKAENPLCPDVKYEREDEDAISFDLVVPAAIDPRMVVKSSVHSSNIGQYGESKTLEVSEAAEWLKKSFPDERRRPLLFALIDGVGFNTNRAGLDRVLTFSDEFCQFRTLWKAAVVAASVVGMREQLALPRGEIRANAAFLRRYDKIIELSELSDEFRTEVPGTLLVPAGDGVIRTPDPKQRQTRQGR